MLIETSQEEQIRGKSRRRWFSDDYFDLIVWQDRNGDVVQFELCYSKNKDEHALSWNRITGHTHHQVDDGESALGRYKLAPILIADGYFDRETVTSKFLEAGKDIDQDITKFVCSKLKDYSEVLRRYNRIEGDGD